MTITEAVQRGLMLFLFVFMVLGILWALIILFSKLVKGLEKTAVKEKEAPQGIPQELPPVQDKPLPTGLWGGKLVLENVDEQTAAMIMAIVSDESGIPLSELVFNKISLVKPREGKNEKEERA